METRENDKQYIHFTLADDTDVIHENVSHEEICEPEEASVLEEGFTEVIVEGSEVFSESDIAVEIITTEGSDYAEMEEDNSGQYPMIYIKRDLGQTFTTIDREAEAVEALRHLGSGIGIPQRVSCNSCNKLFSQSDLAKHQQSCGLKKYVCSICGDKFERKIDLTNHNVCHQVDRPHACRTCGNLFRSKASLQTHMVEVHQVEKPHKCTKCEAEFHRPSSLSNHMKIHSYKAGRALVQSLTNNAIEIVGLNQESGVLQNFEQVQWAVQAYGSQGDKNELDTLQEFTVLPNGEMAPVEGGSSQYLTFNSFNNSDTILKVGNVVKNEGSDTIVEVNIQENRGHVCSHCGVMFARAASLALHEKSHVSKNDWINPVECEYCDKQFQDVTRLTAHQNTCSKKLMQNSADEDGLTAAKWGKHACTECGKKFTTKQKMFRHQWIHRKKTHSCEICGTQFEKQNELDEHRLADHPGDSPFTCTECGKSFVSRQGLWEHGRTHQGSPAHFQCDTCSKTFSSRQGYLIHHRTHTGERPYGCKFCWKAFRDGGTLRKHERIHTGERPHVCPLCSRAFNQKVVLREHVRWVHAAGKNDTEPSGPPFPCPLCSVVNQDRDELCAHIVKHSDQMIAEAKAKFNSQASLVKSKPQKKKAKIIKPEEVVSTSERVITTTEQDQALMSLAEQMASEEMEEGEGQDTYLLVKNEFDDAVCLKAIGKENNMDQNDTIKVIAFAKSEDDDRDGEEEEEEEGNPQPMHLISASGDLIQLISTNKQNNTLQIISKQNENSPVVAIPNPQIKGLNNSKNNAKNSSQHENNKEEETTESPIELIDEQHIKGEIMDEGEDHTCGICGSEFKDRNVLMQHVKVHI